MGLRVLCKMSFDYRVGQGVDIHQFAEGRSLILGGVKIPSEKGLLGHSDADALLHALTDALLGAVGKGDIGAWFPDTDAEWKDADSSKLLATVWSELQSEGWEVVNMDSTILTQAPRMAEYIPAMRSRIAELVNISEDACSVKATTAERLGFVGREEGLTATCVVLIRRSVQ